MSGRRESGRVTSQEVRDKSVQYCLDARHRVFNKEWPRVDGIWLKIPVIARNNGDYDTGILWIDIDKGLAYVEDGANLFIPSDFCPDRCIHSIADIFGEGKWEVD
jgi:hypothetical protein